MGNSVDEKAVQSAEIVGSWVPYGVTSFVELDNAQDAQVQAQTVDMLGNQFLSMAHNIFKDEEIVDKASFISLVVDELSERLGEATNKERENDDPDDIVVLNEDDVGKVLKAVQDTHTVNNSPDDRDDHLKAVWSRAFINDLPDGSFLHILPGGKKEKGKTVPRNLRMFPYKDSTGKVDLPHLRNALSRIPQSNRINAATKKSLTTKARRILAEQSKEVTKGADGLLDRIADAVKSWFGESGSEEANTESTSTTDLTLWKDADGPLRWAAWFSNNYRDDDNPPEIISAAAHREFVKAVDDGEWPKPELWFWHVKGSKFGQVDLVAYAEDTGFTLAAGTIDKGKESIAQYCADNGAPSTKARSPSRNTARTMGIKCPTGCRRTVSSGTQMTQPLLLAIGRKR
jgi:hypothetical protein